MTELAQLIIAIATLIATVGSVWTSLHNGRKIKEVHDATNGMAEKMGAAREAKGLLAGQAESRPKE